MISILHKIFKKILSEEKTIIDGSEMIVIPIYKEEYKLNPANYRAIFLLSIPRKVFNYHCYKDLRYIVNDLPEITNLDYDNIEEQLMQYSLLDKF